MELKIQVNLDNASFEDNPEEIKTLLENVANKVKAGYLQGLVKDSNGNNVGDFILEEV
jgi:hypothetical protein